MKAKVAVALAVLGAVGVTAAMPSDAGALRKATPKERTNILKDRAASLEQQGLGEKGRCRTVGVILRVSSVNGRYVRINFNNVVRKRNRCGVGDGFAVYRKTKATYRFVSDYAWTGAPCYRIPRKIALDLVSDEARADRKRHGSSPFDRCTRR